MDDASQYVWVSVADASRFLKRSPSTIIRQIRSGEIVGEREPLARGSNKIRYRVRLDASLVNDDESADDQSAVMMRLLDRLEEKDTLIERLHMTLRDESGRAEAAEARNVELLRSLAAAESRATQLAADLAAERSKPWWRKLWSS